MEMEEFKKTVARNIIAMRTRLEMTQSELGEKLNYTDKSVSKWERAAALPDIYVLKQMADIFGVSVDWLLTSHGDEELIDTPCARHFRPSVVLLLALTGVLTAAMLSFVVLCVLGNVMWQIFIWMLPVAAVVALVLCTVWYGRRFNMWILSVLLWSAFLCVYVTFLHWQDWQIFLLGIPSQIVVCLAFFVRKPKKKARDPGE